MEPIDVCAIASHWLLAHANQWMTTAAQPDKRSCCVRQPRSTKKDRDSEREQQLKPLCKWEDN
eukprot:269785-Amphidinium_carterae.1